MKMTPTCQTCRCSLTEAKVYVAGQWLCPDCLYESEYGPAQRVKRSRTPNRLHPQEERLFPLPPARRSE